MNAIIVPGYGDRHDYIEYATKNWQQRYGVDPEVYVFGWSDELGSYEEKWQNFEEKLHNNAPTAIIGISAGFSVALRGLVQYPELVTAAVSICGPHDAKDLSRETLHNKYPLLEQAFDSFSSDDLPLDKIMTLRPLFDEVVSVNAVNINGASNERMATVFHAPSIVWGVAGRGKTITEFIKSTVKEN